MKSLNRKIVAVLTALLLMAGSSRAQIFITDDEFEGILRHGESEYVLVVPTQGSDADQFLPVGDGWLVLAPPIYWPKGKSRNDYGIKFLKKSMISVQKI